MALVAHRALPGKIPGALAAVAVGSLVYWAGHYLGQAAGWPIVPPPESHGDAAWRLPELLPSVRAESGTGGSGSRFRPLASLPIMLPFALATIVGGIDCTESAAAAGDEYDTRTILLTEGLASVAAGACGGVIQNTPYIGQPAYKAMGGRAAYTLATAVLVGAAGPVRLVHPPLRLAARGRRLSDPGLHRPGDRGPIVPGHAGPPFSGRGAGDPAGLGLPGHDSAWTSALAGREPDAHAAVAVQSLRCLASGFIVTSLLWASALAAILDGKLLRAAGYLAVAGVCSLFGIIHSPLDPAAIALPHTVFAQMPADPAILCQSPYHWAAAYGLAAGLLVVLSLFKEANGGQNVPFVVRAGACRPGRRVARPGVGVGLDAAVVVVQGRLQEDDRGEPAGHVRQFAGLFGAERPAEQFPLAIAQPFLDDLVAADVVLPHA